MIIVIDSNDKVFATHANAQIDEVLDQYPGKTLRRIIDGLEFWGGEDDPTIAHPEYLEGVQPAAVETAKTDWAALPDYIKNWTPQQVDDYIVANVTDLPSAKVVLRHMARAIVILRDFVRSQ